MSIFTKIHAATGRSVKDLVVDPLDIRGFAHGDRPRNIKNLADPMSVGMAAPSKQLNTAGTIAALIATAGAGGAFGAGASGGAAAGEAGGGVAAGEAGGAGELGSVPGLTSTTTSAPWWQQFASMNPGGQQPNNTYPNYQRMKVARALQQMQEQQYQPPQPMSPTYG